MLLSFFPNTSYIFSILPFHPSQIFASPSRCFSPREGWKWKENPICWEITDWLNIYKIDYCWVFTSHGTGGLKEQEKKKNLTFMFPRSIHLFSDFLSWTNGKWTNAGRLGEKQKPLFVCPKLFSSPLGDRQVPNRQLSVKHNREASDCSPELSQKTSALEIISYAHLYSHSVSVLLPCFSGNSPHFLPFPLSCFPLNQPQTLKNK